MELKSTVSAKKFRAFTICSLKKFARVREKWGFLNNLCCTGDLQLEQTYWARKKILSLYFNNAKQYFITSHQIHHIEYSSLLFSLHTKTHFFHKSFAPQNYYITVHPPDCFPTQSLLIVFLKLFSLHHCGYYIKLSNRTSP